MQVISQRLKGFERRVRLVRAWRGIAIGACMGAAVDAVWAILDWRGLAYTEWSQMGLVFGGGALIGGLVGLGWRVSQKGLSDSIDRRAGLENRLTTALERSEQHDSFDAALQADAEQRFANLKPAKVYPVRVGRWHAGAIALSAVAASIFLLGNSPLLLSDEAKKDHADLKKQGQTVERITKENLEDPKDQKDMTEDERKLDKELRKYQKDLEKARLTKEDALQKANELQEKAEELTKQSAEATQESLAQAETALEKMQKAELEKSNMGKVDPSMAQLSTQQREEALKKNAQKQKDLKDQMKALQNKLDDLNKQLANKNLSAEQRKALEEQKKALEAAMKDLQKQMKNAQSQEEALKLSKDAMDVFNKMMKNPLYKQLQELAEKMAKKLGQAAEAGQQKQRPKLTKEEREEMQKHLEELARELKDDKAMEAYLKALVEAMKNANKLGRCANLIPGLHIPIPGAGMPTQDIWQGDTGVINKLDKPVASQGKTFETQITGQKRETAAPEAYVEIKAPTLVGNRTSVPYKQVLPSYKKKAEAALDHQQIPKEHEKRVREYFESLTGGKKN